MAWYGPCFIRDVRCRGATTRCCSGGVTPLSRERLVERRTVHEVCRERERCRDHTRGVSPGGCSSGEGAERGVQVHCLYGSEGHGAADTDRLGLGRGADRQRTSASPEYEATD